MLFKNLSVGRNFLVVTLNKRVLILVVEILLLSLATCEFSEDKTLLGECGEKIWGDEQRKFVPLLSETLRDDAHL